MERVAFYGLRLVVDSGDAPAANPAVTGMKPCPNQKCEKGVVRYEGVGAVKEKKCPICQGTGWVR